MVAEIHYRVGGGIGDVLHQTCVLKAMKHKFPDTPIKLYVETAPNRINEIKALHENNPYCDGFTKDHHFTFDCENAPSIGVIYESMCQAFDLDVNLMESPIHLTEEEIQWAKDKLESMGLDTNKLIGIGERVRPKKVWHGYKELIQKLQVDGYHVIQLGKHKPPENETVPMLLARDLDMDIRKTIAIMSQCKAFVSIGSGLAIASYWLDVPLIGLWGGVAEAFWFTKEDMESNKVTILKGPCDLYCGGEQSPCQKGMDAFWTCMKISVEDVFNSIKEVVKLDN